ncbi:Proteinaceous RNase P 1, chloroplastic/mitochondrial [Linum perenne]
MASYSTASKLSSLHHPKLKQHFLSTTLSKLPFIYLQSQFSCFPSHFLAFSSANPTSSSIAKPKLPARRRRTRKGNDSGTSSPVITDKRLDSQSAKELASNFLVENTLKSNLDDDGKSNKREIISTAEEKGNKVDSPAEGSLALENAGVSEKKKKKKEKGKKTDGEKEGKPSKKKSKVVRPGVQRRIQLDMCSRRGDVVGAIKFYDSAIKEGIGMGQYEYSVILYLCSSAAVGVVQPAKSGTSNPREVYDESPQTSIGSTESDASVSNDGVVQVSEHVRKYALQRGLEIYESIRFQNVLMNEATLTAVARMAMSMGNGDMAFDMVKNMTHLGITPKLRSYIPALTVYCQTKDVDKAFRVENHMLEHGVSPEASELEALLRVSVEVGRGDKVYYLLHKLRTSVRRVSPSTADLIVRWFSSTPASRVGKRKWTLLQIKEAIENGGGGWHGQGWLGRGKWRVSSTTVGPDASCRCCGEKLATIDLDPSETEKFAGSVASIALKSDKDSSFAKFQKWLDHYGPFEAVVDGANVGLSCYKIFMPSKINAIWNGIRKKLPSKKWPLIVLYNRRVSGMTGRKRKALLEKWKDAHALFATPTGSNDDWYWLYAAIKFKSLIVTNDEMRDHTFQLLGNDFFPKWKERHQVRFRFDESGPVFCMPPPYSVVIQESEEGHWHIPIAVDEDEESERAWLCITRANMSLEKQVSNAYKREGNSSSCE